MPRAGWGRIIPCRWIAKGNSLTCPPMRHNMPSSSLAFCWNQPHDDNLPRRARVDHTRSQLLSVFHEPRGKSLSTMRRTSSVSILDDDTTSTHDNSLFHGLKSSPKEEGTWVPHSPLSWAKDFGRRSPSLTDQLHQLAKLSHDDEGYFDQSCTSPISGVTVVRTIEQAQIVVSRLLSEQGLDVRHACDTEVMALTLPKVGPVGNGFVTCVSIYSGPDFDYGLGDGPGTTLWIDNLDDSFGVLQEFKSWFENELYLKVWHNYGFDRHVLWNEGINVKGFGGDTMHMARLQDTSRSKLAGDGNHEMVGYSLEALTFSLLGRRKRPMKEIFGIHRLRKDGSEGILVDMPSVEVLQRDPRFREKWIIYSAFDAEGTWLLRVKLQEMLEAMEWYGGQTLYDYYELHMRRFGEVLTDMERRGISLDAKEYLAKVEVQAREDRKYHLKEFRKWSFRQIGADGLALNPASSTQLCTFLFGGAINSKTKERIENVRVFKLPREEIPDEVMEAYKDRDAQEQKHALESTTSEEKPTTDEFDNMNVAQLKVLCKERRLKVSGRKSELQERLRESFMTTKHSQIPIDDFDAMSTVDLCHACIARGLDDTGNRKALLERLKADSAFVLEMLTTTSPSPLPSVEYKTISEALEAVVKGDAGRSLKKILEDIKAKKQVSRHFEVTIRSIGMSPEKFTDAGAPSVTADVLRKLAGDPFVDPPTYGSAYDYLGRGKEGHEACVALYSLTTIGSIDTMIGNFLTNLQSLTDHNSRVHCSLNLNTETGRLSSRKPNLQNQPALEKDKYKIRRAFQASPGNNLIVADYGQLELRLLASITQCRSMIDAFQAGGDFHSRTAMDMFDYIEQKVDAGDCLLEWDYSQGNPPKPMLKDMFAAERRKAKTLNFSIAYGKTAHGLSKDWGVSVPEAEKMLQAWYNSRPEVKKWQNEVKKETRKLGFTRTLHGRYRQLPGAMTGNRKLLGHALRASINTPIQGGAADVAMMAMIKINDSDLLKRLGWILLMQIHDEFILEGPEETAKEAFEEVKKCMQTPWVHGLQSTVVPLLVDGSYQHKNWYDAK